MSSPGGGGGSISSARRQVENEADRRPANRTVGSNFEATGVLLRGKVKKAFISIAFVL